ncbi:peptidylprolyl isomerase [Cellulophaga tyrosinoxydans]|uniref:Periplasmic chaperone for outer membrane proteins SurA n=1 Tax=Cellulophaga tyrosinoxydans TaxID=504486 RepID=A0A1W2C1I4_9FLAO|nr:peptidylprolyl isomerase [Cellulophaga tyrosinoxydans]SMC79000.1 periplasmic chaperone for outer membrane proteins SurA [Cellulophaga tyrosinoxydans]
MLKIKNTLTILLVLIFGAVQAQDTIEAATAEPINDVAQVSQVSDSIKPFKKIKLDGVAAVVGDYLILESDIDKTLIDLRNQGVSADEVSRCGLLGKLMEDRLYAHQAVQDSILVADDEVNATSDAQIAQLVSKVGSIEKVLAFYKKQDEESFREELYKINKLRMLSEKMQRKIVEEIEITPEEVRQFFNKIPEDQRPVFGAELEIAQIVKKPEAPEEEKQKVLDRLNKIREDVLERGSSFAVKAILYTEDPGSKQNGGLYTGITKQTGFAKEFKDMAFSLNVGEVSEPFETSFGIHILTVDKILGQQRDVRHILMIPKVPQSALDAAKKELDTIRQGIIDGKFTFAEAALNFSDQTETKFDGGQLRNPSDYGSRFELTNMDPTFYNQIRNLKDNEISQPILEEDPREGTSYKIMKITNRYDEHEADFSKDYLKIQQLALTQKQADAIGKWMKEHIEDTYVSVNASNQDCDFTNNWVKK